MAFPKYSMFPPADQELSFHFRTFGHPIRKHILVDLKHGKMSVSEMIRLYPLSRETLYQHLATLRSAGVLHYEEIIPHTFYWRNEPQIERIKKLLSDFLNDI
jgi:DNA-binding transcriptional ArsR family regulator